MASAKETCNFTHGFESKRQ